MYIGLYFGIKIITLPLVYALGRLFRLSLIATEKISNINIIIIINTVY